MLIRIFQFVLFLTYSAYLSAKPLTHELHVKALEEYISDCTVSEYGICIEKVLMLDDLDVITVQMKINNDLFGNGDNEPKDVLRLTMLTYLIMFNSKLADELNLTAEYFDFENPEIDQNKIVLVGEIVSDDGTYSGYYRYNPVTGFVAYEISSSYQSGLNLFHSRLKELSELNRHTSYEMLTKVKETNVTNKENKK